MVANVHFIYTKGKTVSKVHACTFTLFEMSDGPNLSVQTDFSKSRLSCVCWAGCLSVCLPVWTLESVTALLPGHPPEAALAFLAASCIVQNDILTETTWTRD